MGSHSGGLVQLIAKGHENMYLTDNPQITWFKVQYRRHTNFSIEPIQQNFTHTPNFGSKSYCNLGTKTGDLIHKVNLVITLPEIPQFYNSDQTLDTLTKFAWVRKIGYNIIKEIDVEIGGKLIDRHYGEWLNIWSELSGKKNEEIDKLIGNVRELYEYSASKNAYELFIPLKFWFCNYLSSSLPVICLFHNDVKINLELEDFSNLFKISPTHYILMENDIVNFIENEYIVQNINDVEIAGQFVYFDPLTKRLYYNRISSQLFQNINAYNIMNGTQTDTVKYEQLAMMHEKYKITGLTSKYFAFPEINFEQQKINSVSYSYNFISNINLRDCYLLVDYIFLDEQERKRLYKNKHEYLIEQLISAADTVTSGQLEINVGLYNPVKYIIWFAQQQYLIERYNNDFFNYTNSYKYYDILNNPNDKQKNNKQVGKGLITSSLLLLNSIERIKEQPKEYYEIVQPLQHFKYCPQSGINLYSFSLFPMDFQPSGSCNMSGIDNVKMLLNFDTIININNQAKIKIYGIAYNILRIDGGLGGVIYVN